MGKIFKAIIRFFKWLFNTDDEYEYEPQVPTPNPTGSTGDNNEPVVTEPEQSGTTIDDEEKCPEYEIKSSTRRNKNGTLSVKFSVK